MKTTDSVMREKGEKFLVPKDLFTFKIAPTMAAVLEMEGEIELEMEGKYYKIMSEEKIHTLISHSLAEARREERQYIISELEQVARVHKYLSPEILEKVKRFIENFDKPGEEMLLTGDNPERKV